jgi:hypothetical protein
MGQRGAAGAMGGGAGFRFSAAYRSTNEEFIGALSAPNVI